MQLFVACLLSFQSSPGAMEGTLSQISGQSKDVPSSLTPEEPPINFTHVRLEENEPTDFSTKDFILKKAREVCKCNHQTIITFCQLFPVLDWLPRYDVRTQFLGRTWAPGGDSCHPSVHLALAASQPGSHLRNLHQLLLQYHLCGHGHFTTQLHWILRSPLPDNQAVCEPAPPASRVQRRQHWLCAGGQFHLPWERGWLPVTGAVTVALSLSFLVGLYQVRMFTAVLFPLCPFPARNF